MRAMNLNPSELSKEEDATPVHVRMNIDEHTMNSWLLLINDLTIHPQRNGQLNGSNKNRRKIKINAHDNNDHDRRAKLKRRKGFRMPRSFQRRSGKLHYTGRLCYL